MRTTIAVALILLAMLAGGILVFESLAPQYVCTGGQVGTAQHPYKPMECSWQ